MPPSALCWPRNLKLKSQSSPSSPPKSVQIDESKNMVFSYQSGSTIVAFLPLADSDSLQDRSDDDQDDDHENPLHKNDKTSFRNSSIRVPRQQRHQSVIKSEPTPELDSGDWRSNRRVSRTPSGTGDRQPGKPPRIPMLRRQASMPSLEREMSEENPFLEPPPTWNPAISQSRDSEQSSEEVVNSSLISSTPVIQELDPAGRNECREVVMAEVGSEVKVNTSQALIESTNSNATTLTPTASSKSSRGVIRRRDTRHSHHPYRRPAPISNASQDTALLSLPAQFRRAASFNGTTSTPVVQPVLRREASTTAYMDTL
ncbi:hypothetical protein EC991_005479 [Linnemannia zychae]|nr:hypothetical protein EC991_005479 [Linnemannia zychae]